MKQHAPKPVKKGTARTRVREEAAPADMPTAVVAATSVSGTEAPVTTELHAGDSATVASDGTVTVIPEGHIVQESGEVVPDPSRRSYAG